MSIIDKIATLEAANRNEPPLSWKISRKRSELQIGTQDYPDAYLILLTHPALQQAFKTIVDSPLTANHVEEALYRDYRAKIRAKLTPT